MLWKKQKRIEDMVLKHLEKVEECLGHYQEALSAYLDGNIDKAEEFALATHASEGQADDVRREVEAALIGGALLASSRRDTLEVIEQVDKLANAGEGTLDYLLLQQVNIPEDVKPFIRDIAATTATIATEVNLAMRSLFEDMNATTEHTKQIEIKESEVDRVERNAVKTIFKMDLDLAWKLQLYGLIEELVEISDRAEDLSDRIDMVVAQRRL